MTLTPTQKCVTLISADGLAELKVHKVFTSRYIVFCAHMDLLFLSQWAII